MANTDNLINFLRPSEDSSESLYKQLSQSLNRAIQEGLLNPGDSLMPERDLALNLKMSRITIRKAIDQLVEIGLLIKRQGSGTVVSENVDLVLHKNLSSLNSFTADMKKRGLESYSRITLREEGKASAKEALILNLSESDFVHRLNRVRYLVNEPLLYEIAVIPASIISIKSAIDNSLYELLESKNVNPVKAKQNIHAIVADDNLADKLEIAPGSAVLFVERRGKDANGQVVEYTQSYYRGDRYDYVVELG
ncbi:MAG: GntR family transcriptional regulator [Pseudomonadota bacterium]|nr:GntR family transcriptional regulator [Pseudomonadota bacterium]